MNTNDQTVETITLCPPVIYKLLLPKKSRQARQPTVTDPREIPIGTRVMKLYLVSRWNRYVTIPGASLFVMTADGLQHDDAADD